MQKHKKLPVTTFRVKIITLAFTLHHPCFIILVSAFTFGELTLLPRTEAGSGDDPSRGTFDPNWQFPHLWIMRTHSLHQMCHIPAKAISTKRQSRGTQTPPNFNFGVERSHLGD